VPLAFFCLALASLSLVVSLIPLAAPLQVTLNQACALVASWMMTSADGFARLPGGNLHVPSLTQRREAGEVELRCLALPRGAEAMVLRVGGDHWMLDCGSERAFGSVVLPTLRRAGINRLEGVFLSHADAAHVGGAEGLLRSLQVGALLHPGHEPWRLDSRQSRLRRLLERPAGRREAWPPAHPLLADDVVPLTQVSGPEGLRPARLTVLHPGPRDRRTVADDRGLVSLLELGPLRVLWMADAGMTTEFALLERGVDVRCDVLIRGARVGDIHGTSAFLQAADPALIISAGESGLPGQKLPASVSLHALKRGIPLHVLPTGGEVTLRLAAPTAREITVQRFLTAEPLVVPLRR
jgi:beta-lactamase superfamily II metal-dependent hydrolase